MPDWKDDLPPDLKEAPSIQKFADTPSLAKSYLELERMVGSSIRPPGPDAAPEVKTEFLNKFTKQFPELVNVKDENALLAALGRPAKPEEYVPPADAGTVSDDLLASWRQTAAELGLTKRQAEAALKKQTEMYMENQGRITQAQGELKKEWGAALEERTRLAAAAAEKVGFPPEVVTLIKSGKGSSKEMVGFFNIAKALGLDQPGNHVGQQGPGATPGPLTPLEIHSRIEEIRKNPAYFNASTNPTLHTHLMNEVVRLYGQLPSDG